jgi:hypothetical protein
VDFQTVDGTATVADNDYQTNNGTLNFAANETSKQITVLVNGDTTNETDETFTVHLSNASGATISDADGDRPVSITIKDNDASAGSALFYANGAIQAQGTTLTVAASDLTGIYVQGGASLGHNSFTITADDGYANGVGSPFTFDVNTRLPNRAPVVTPTAATQGVSIGSAVQASTLFAVNDPDGDAMSAYQFYDAGAGGGHFTVNGVTQGAALAMLREPGLDPFDRGRTGNAAA